MALVNPSDLKLVKSAVVNNNSNNGGRMSTNLIAAGVANALFPSAGVDERTAGSVVYRKAFWHNRNAANEVVYDFQAYLENYTQAGDEIVFFAATQTDVQDDITGSEDLYGVGQLNADVSAGATEITVSVHDWANYPIFRNGSLLRISDKPTFDGAGDTEFVEIHASTAINAAGNIVTIPLAAPLTNDWVAADTRVASIYEAGDLEPTVDNVVKTTAAGTLTDAEVVGTNKGTIEQSLTVTFTSATAFDVSSDVLGSLGSGTVGANFAPSNAAMGAAYFTIPSSAWGGTWANGDTVDFDTHPAAVPVWMVRDIPALTGAQSGNKAVAAWLGGSN